ncbi:predicted protein [Nematostella vectensis]|uniref:Haem-binding uptake Tiki superfamily ChaN domain-containing protein n=1 Tax=Nematostella vectensis TaxID=45351 RepID=A7SKA3_NEMVE|nr:predicted protein [Nematostella vectensis]|eukprot:XP_001627933.1 predicted protein [Nematostella vectensis]
MNFIRNIHDDCMANWVNASNQLRSTLRQLSSTLVFSTEHGPPGFLFEKVMSRARDSRVVLFGEQHEEPSILKAQLCVLERMVTEQEQNSTHPSSVTLILEMFNVQQQPLLDAYQEDQITLQDLENQYRGTEGFQITGHYGFLLEAAKNLQVKIVAGFAPKSLCYLMIKEGKESMLEKAKELVGFEEDFYVDGSEEHYEYFQGLISGNQETVTDRYRKIFPAQILKDSMFASTVLRTLSISDQIKVLGICGSGHVDYKFLVGDLSLCRPPYVSVMFRPPFVSLSV